MKHVDIQEKKDNKHDFDKSYFYRVKQSKSYNKYVGSLI